MSKSAALGEEKTISLPEGTLHYRERGSGAPLVFVHGLLVNGDLWRKVVPLLADRFRCITPDWPLGSHATPLAPDADLTPSGLARIIVRFLDALGLDSVTLVGNDTGGAICQLVVAAQPERVGRLVLTNCDAYDVFPPRFFSYIKWNSYLPGGTYLLAQTMRLRPLRRLPIAFGWLSRHAPEPEVSDGFVGPIASSAGVRHDATKIIRSISSKYTRAAAETFPSFAKPVLLAWAPDDRFFPMRLAERMAQAFPNARLERIEGSRTFVPEDQPERLAALIASFAS
jgi:pimeloyl-ACP methyl ester carboxylesterase